MISYVEAVEKIWESFAQVVTYAPYKLGFDKVTSELGLGFDFKTFCICNTQLRFFHAKIWLFFRSAW